MERLSRLLVAPIVALIVGGVAAAVTLDVDVADLVSPPPATTTTAIPATTTTTPPPLFPPIVPGFEVNTVRTTNGYVLPVLGGGPGAWVVRTPCQNDATVPAVPVPGAHVVLDPGHGGSEPGAVGPALGLVEKDVNLRVALRVRDRLEALGAVVAMTRDHDVRVTLATRGEIARSLDPIVLVSIHHNAAPLGTRATPAPEVYHQLDDPESRRIAGLLHEEYVAHFAAFGADWGFGDDPGARARRSIRTGGDFYGILRNAGEVPAILSEPAYLSNPAEEALLATDAFVDAEATAIVDALVRFLSTPDPGSGFRPVKEAAASAGGGGGTVGCVDPEL